MTFLGNFRFTLVNCHVFYGSGTNERTAELPILAEVVKGVIQNNRGEKDVLLLGDFVSMEFVS